MVHHRIFVSTLGLPVSSRADFAWDISNYSTLKDFSGKTVHFALEWLTPIAASEINNDYAFDANHPWGLILELTNIPQFNTYTSWSRNTSSVLAVLPGYVGTGYYGVQQDTPYLQTTALGGLTRGDDLARKGELEFRLRSTGDLLDPAVRTFQPTSIKDYSFSVVFWTVDPERPLVPYDHFHLWVSTADRRSGTPDDAIIPVDMTTFSMHEGAWNLAVSYISPVYHNVLPADVKQGMILDSPTFQSAFSNRNAIAYLNRTHVAGEEKYYGRRLSVHPVNSDTVGVPLRNAVDSLGEIRLRLVDPITYERADNGNQVKDYVACLTIYRLTQ